VRLGSLFVEIGRILVRARGLFEVDTENVVAGVEGTEYVLQFAPDRSVKVIVFDGVVVCRSPTGSWSPIRLRGGEAFVSEYPNRSAPLVRPASREEWEHARVWVYGSETRPEEGYCCEDGKVSRTIRSRCAGRFFFDRNAAYEECRPPVESGYCCEEGKVFPSTRIRCARVKGRFIEDGNEAERACRPRPEEGYCCIDGMVRRSTQDACRGFFSRSEKEAVVRCESLREGYCCSDGKVSRETRNRCTGRFFLDRDAAYEECRPPVQSGYCCDEGKVFPTTRDRCLRVKGRFYDDRKEAEHACRTAPGVIDRPKPSAPVLY
jgi:hypothetical protein